ncbi:PadR family transcriptional regulator [Candidatus Bathyarchaeota archaeon]|nr:PadR family transcriptional regulator [Candidatus Bathyarchaeota archaeon]
MSSGDLEPIILDFSRFYILIILYEGPCHGYSILSKFKRRVGKDISPSLVYPFLKQLEEKGLVKHSIRIVGNKRKKIFELTDEGREFCKRLFRRFSALVSATIEPNLTVCANCGCKIYEGGYREVINGKEMVFCCIHCAESYKRETEGI